MTSPTLWSKTPFFYPIGNTPPVCLTQGLAPEEPADILLLGCGDPRNILATVHFDLDDTGRRKLDFTCCDLETAVLARNILLLTAIADGIAWLNAWHIFYHLFIDDTSLEILLSQCRKLIHSSHDLTSWNTSNYGKYIRFCTEESMNEIRQLWELYLSTNNLSKQEKDTQRKSFSSHMKQIREKYSDDVDLTMVTSAGPINHQALVLVGKQVLRTFWENGFMESSTTGTTIAPHVNPTFVYSLAGSEFNVHHRTNPLSAFHLAPALSPTKGTSQSSQITGADLVGGAMRQFSTWCTSFYSRVKAENPSLTIRIFVGDCIPFCQALRMCRSGNITKTGSYSHPWGLSQINLTEDYGGLPSSPPLLFNVIDSSNLTDHIGLLSLVLVASPLLQRTPWSILQTDTLGLSASDRKIESALLDRIFCDIPTLSILLGVAPSFHLHPFSTECCKNGPMAVGMVESGYFYQPISWKYPSFVASYAALAYPEVQAENPSLACDELCLAKFLLSFYMQMFSEENITNLGNMTVNRYKLDHLHYTRTSFVSFLSFVKERVQVDWTKTMEHLIDLLEAEKKLLLGMTNYQDFICQLHLHDLYTVDTLRWDYLRSIRTPGDYFEGWPVVPSVVSVVLKVPRGCLKVLEDSDRMDIGFPILVGETRGSNTQNMHSSIRLSFGDVVYSGRHADARVVITEDPAGWQGQSPLIISFDAASWLFTKRGNIRSVGLCARTTALFTRNLYSKIGLNQSIFSAPLDDKQHVFITKHRPNDSREIYTTKDNTPLTTVESRTPVITIDFSASATRVESLAVRSVLDQDAAKVLANGVSVSTKIIGDTAVLASFGSYSQIFHFPFPIDANRIKTKIARKSSYIELVAPPRREIDISSPNLFPISQTKMPFNLLNISYLKLSVLPILRLPLSAENTRSLSMHLASTLSDQERIKQQSTARHEEKGMIINLKESISTFSLKGSELGVPQIFGLSSPTIGAYALIFVNDLKLDLTSQTIVTDACVIPLNEKNGAKVLETMRRSSKQETISIPTLEDEVGAWKLLLPAFVERCRTWQHGALCEYRTKGIPACSKDDGWDNTTSPLCSCGLGKDLGAFGAVDDWKTIRSEATRIAISPLFPLLPPQKSLVDLPISKDSGKDIPDANVCANCGGSGQQVLLVCGRCKKIQYCSKMCQKAHWGQHKANCKK